VPERGHHHHAEQDNEFHPGVQALQQAGLTRRIVAEHHLP
jgi:hypothetical protein